MQIYENLKLTMPMTMTTDSNDTQKIGAAYKARSFPTLFVIGGSGEVESVHIGAKRTPFFKVGKELKEILSSS